MFVNGLGLAIDVCLSFNVAVVFFFYVFPFPFSKCGFRVDRRCAPNCSVHFPF
jgi:hypothetical protein